MYLQKQLSPVLYLHQCNDIGMHMYYTYFHSFCLTTGYSHCIATISVKLDGVLINNLVKDSNYCFVFLKILQCARRARENVFVNVSNLCDHVMLSSPSRPALQLSCTTRLTRAHARALHVLSLSSSNTLQDVHVRLKHANTH